MNRYVYVDIHFFHKHTCAELQQEFGPAGPLMWLALLCQGKNHRPAGEFTWTSEADAFEQLFGASILPTDVKFTFEDFLKVTGRLKQTRRAKTDRRRRGRVANVALTRWDQWQKESRKWSERERKSRKRDESEADTERTPSGQDADTSRTKAPSSSRTITTPQTPQTQNGKHPHDCPVCGTRQPSRSALADHVARTHAPEPAVARDDDIPF